MEQPRNPFLVARILVFAMIQSVLVLALVAYLVKPTSGTSEAFPQELCYALACTLCLVSFALPRLLSKSLPPSKVSFETLQDAMRFHQTPLILALALADAGAIVCFGYTITSGDINPLLGIGIFSIAIMVSHLPSEEKMRDLYQIEKRE